MDQFQYSLSDLNNSIKFDDESVFDSIFKKRWSSMHNDEKKNIFRYKLPPTTEHRIVKGNFDYFLELNIDRAQNRRTPQEISSVKQPVNKDKFNFNKITDDEIMFEVKCKDDSTAGNFRDLFIINSSPICYGHCLFCPEVENHLPQIITLKSLIKGVRIMFLSRNRNLRMGFNSLCAMASVNHLHYHFLIVDYRLPIETTVCEHLIGPLYTMKDFPAKAFCFQIKNKDEIDEKCSEIYKLTNYCIENEIAHNFYMTFGDSLDGTSDPVLRIFIWVRKSSYGVKQLSAFNLAICEFSGQYPIKNDKEFYTLTDVDIENALEDCTSEVFNSIVEDVVQIYT